MNKERLKNSFLIIFTFLGAVLLGLVFFKYILPILLPFILAWGFALAIRPTARALHRRLRVPVRIISPILALLLILLAVATVAALAVTLAVQGWGLLSSLAEGGKLEALIKNILNPFDGRLEGAFSSELEGHLNEAIGGLITRLLSSVATLLTSIVTGVPKILLFLLVTVIATVYFSIDLDRINAYLLGLLPKRIGSAALAFKQSTLGVMLKYLRSYGILMLITFAIMLVGFTFLKIKYSLLLAELVALLDALPVLGVGTVLVPYSLIAFIGGDTALGIGLLVLLMINEIVRQLVEPKILGKHLGIHPLLTVVMLYAGYSLFGFLGLILLPIIAVALKPIIEKQNSAKIKKEI